MILKQLLLTIKIKKIYTREITINKDVINLETKYNNTYLEAKTINKNEEEIIEIKHIYYFRIPQTDDVLGEVTKIKGASIIEKLIAKRFINKNSN